MIRLTVALALTFALLGSAVALVHVQHQRRTLFVELERLERERDALVVHHGRLTLEHGTWSTHERVERIATGELGLRRPDADAIVLVTP